MRTRREYTSRQGPNDTLTIWLENDASPTPLDYINIERRGDKVRLPGGKWGSEAEAEQAARQEFKRTGYDL
jgi:hypothetical protein